MNAVPLGIDGVSPNEFGAAVSSWGGRVCFHGASDGMTAQPHICQPES